ncbi:FANCF protein, partial [Piaya cayana]|nr:FANCF protein [Piaya cayana]
GAMEAVLGQVEQLPALLAVSRSALVRDWDPLTLDRALDWARYFQQLHHRFRTRPRLREAIGRRLRQGQLGFAHLGRCPQLLALALLENRALPPAACSRLLHRLLQPRPGEPPLRPGEPPLRPGEALSLLARRKAAARLLPPPPRGQAEAQLLLLRLREEEEEEEGDAAGLLARALDQLPQPRAFEVAAAALLQLVKQEGSSPRGIEAAGGGDVAGLLLSWVLENTERFSALCLHLPGSLLASLAGHYSQLSRSYLDLLTSWGSQLLYDPLQGEWVKVCSGKAELSWEELRERFSCLCQGSALLREQTQAALKLLKARDGDFEVRGLSVWTDLLMEVEEHLKKQR